MSVATAWEVAIKHRRRRLTLPYPPEEFIPKALAEDGFLGLAITLSHAIRAGGLPVHHKDPFDRMLVAQAQLENLAILTSDPMFSTYEVQVVPA